MPERTYTEDGHVIEVTETHCRARCTEPDDCACHTACDECTGSGYVYDDQDEEQPCPVCDESGLREPHECYIAVHADLWVALEDDVYERGRPEPGTYKLLWDGEGYGEDYEFYARIGTKVPAEEGTQTSA